MGRGPAIVWRWTGAESERDQMWRDVEAAGPVAKTRKYKSRHEVTTMAVVKESLRAKGDGRWRSRGRIVSRSRFEVRGQVRG